MERVWAALAGAARTIKGGAGGLLGGGGVGGAGGGDEGGGDGERGAGAGDSVPRPISSRAWSITLGIQKSVCRA